MAGRLSVFVAVVLVMCAEFPRSNGFQWLKPIISSDQPPPDYELQVIFNPSSVSLNLTWKWTLTKDDDFGSVYIKRHKVNDELNTKTDVAYSGYKASGLKHTIDTNYYSQQVNTKKDGGVTFTIKDVTKQTNNKGGSPVNVFDDNYVFTCALIAASSRTSKIKLIVNQKPKITTPPQSLYINEANKEFKLNCVATAGKPKPDISWYIEQFNGESKYSQDLKKFDPFQRDNAGVYKCKAKNIYGEDTAEAIVQYTLCGTGCSSKELAVEINKLDYEDGYNNDDSDEYKKLKKLIETVCLHLYTNQSDPKIYSCVVKQFRKGSVVAVMKLTYPSGTEDPDKPLREAIETGRFAGYDVATSFVSPTSPPTSKPTDKPTDEPTGTPGAGARGTPSGGLSTGAIVAIVVVFSIIFIVIIVVLIVCMVKRRKPAGSSKPYQEDGAYNKTSTAPLQSQPYKEDPYDNASDKPKEVVYADLNFQDRYPNGGGPPPQYTPSSNYAEVQPSQGEQDESQVEWDKSVKDEMWI